ncbi:hypothetical protein DPMN_112134 [Dreissena polymorpha]|uniref:Uncharacterized protein n=1 Tax=Dreissena polymorpha TaxID=45954 RepID=A0A9D4KFQ9_DREPO|nr:hypothetical protein DPMN_112134 [Dreissena polymorpha]
MDAGSSRLAPNSDSMVNFFFFTSNSYCSSRKSSLCFLEYASMKSAGNRVPMNFRKSLSTRVAPVPAPMFFEISRMVPSKRISCIVVSIPHPTNNCML